MKIAGVSCEYKQLNEYLYWCGTNTPPTISQIAKKKIIFETKAFIDKLNKFYLSFNEKNMQSLKSDSPSYTLINKQILNWHVFSACFNFIKTKIVTGEVYFDIDKFEKNFANKYVLDEVKLKSLEMYSYTVNPKIESSKKFSFAANQLHSGSKMNQYYKNGTYCGLMDLINNKKHGKGTYTWKNGDVYVGDWNNGVRQGKGTYTWADGDKYVGSFQNGKMHGYGEYFYNSGTLKHYAGNWRNDVRCGKGTMKYRSGSVYTGVFQNNNRHGYGEMLYNDGSSYSGIWENDYMSVLGRYDYASGACYIGGFNKGKFDGFGVKYQTDGSLIFGYFEDDEATYRACFLSNFSEDPYLDNSFLTYGRNDYGQYYGEILQDYCEYGIFIYDSGAIYIGEFFDDDFSGHGTYIFNNHDFYRGHFSDGKFNGNGYLYLNDGKFVHAHWQDDEPFASIKHYDIDGTLISSK